ncbi:MAG: methyltransferase family protein [Candidatus Binatales bacterium]
MDQDGHAPEATPREDRPLAQPEELRQEPEGREIDREIGRTLGGLAVFLVAVVGAVALGLGISDYLGEHPYVTAYLLAYAGFRIADAMLTDVGETRIDRGDASARWRRELPLLLLFAAAPFERTYLYGGEAPQGVAAFGLLMALAGLWFAIGARVQWRFGAGHEGNAVVRTGFYRYVRHPVREGTCLILFAWPFEYGAPITAVVAIAVLFVASRRAIRAEEAELIARFGEEYESYRRETDRLIPNVW